MDEINEKMYDFEANKRNNLIFYGIANETRETQPKLLQKATKLLSELPHDDDDHEEDGWHKLTAECKTTSMRCSRLLFVVVDLIFFSDGKLF